MNIVWFTWKDILHPAAGGAEVMGDELASRLTKDGHSVIILTSRYKNSQHKEALHGYTIIRVGGRYSVYLFAAMYYLQHLRTWPDFIIEEINTVPFFTQLYARQKKMLLIYQLCREIWFHEIFFPFSYIGYVVEPLYLKLLNKNIVITESESSKNDIASYGFQKNSINVFPVGVSKSISKMTSRYSSFTVASIGSIRSMKQTLHQIRAFEIAKIDIPELKLIVAGAPVGMYGEKVIAAISSSQYSKDISYLGHITAEKKYEIMSRSHALLLTSVKEGWGLVVTEAGILKTPSIVYDVDGLRDAVHNGTSGYITSKNTPASLAKKIVDVYNQPIDKRFIDMEWFKTFTLDKSYQAFRKILFDL